MRKSPFIWLGSGRAKRRDVARRGVVIDQVAKARLPVPEGAILMDELLRIYLEEGVAEQRGQRIHIPDPLWQLEVLYRDVRFPRLNTTAVLRALPADGCAGSLPACGRGQGR